MILKIEGERASQLFKNESGGHRWQRKSPTGRGEMHSSTVTVAVLGIKKSKFELNLNEVEISAYIGQGPGGQHRQKNATAIRAVHQPTGIMATCENERSQNQNKEFALQVLAERVRDHYEGAAKSKEAASRKAQIGSGERSDKIRTVQEQNGIVVNHLTGKKIPIQEYKKGKIEKLIQ